MTRRTTLILGLAVVVLAVLIAWELVGHRSQPIAKVGSTAPNVHATTIMGQNFSLDGLRGEPVFLDFFATWCGPCQQEAPVINEFANQLRGKVHVVLIDRADSRALIREFIGKYKVENNITVLYNYPDKISGLFGVTGQPEGVFLNPQGRVTAHTEGPLSLKQLKQLAKQAS